MTVSPKLLCHPPHVKICDDLPSCPDCYVFVSAEFEDKVLGLIYGKFMHDVLILIGFSFSSEMTDF